MILIRHPRPAVRRGTCYGRMEVPAGETAEAEIAACLARTPSVSAVIASPAVRCRRLAERLAGRDGVDLRLDPRLLELDFGAWEGLPWDRIDRAESDPWAADPWSVAPPGGERFAELHARVAEALSQAPAGAALVTHAGVVRAARMILHGVSFERAFAEAVPHAEPLHVGAREEAPWPTSR